MKKEKRKERGVCGSRWERKRMKEASEIFFFFFFFLGVTYSCVLKKKKCSNRLAIAAFLKSAAIGPPKRKCTWEASEFLVVLKNTAIGCHFKIYTLDLWPRFSKTWL